MLRSITRVAIELRDPVAAANDVGQALAFARRLPDRPSKLLLSEPHIIEPGNPSSASGTAVSHARMTAFDAQVKLVSAQAELDGNNLQAADTDLHAVQTGVPSQLIAGDLALLRAAASLEMARNAVPEGRIPELRTQLLTAQLALSGYAGPGHIAESKAMATAIGQTLGQGSALDTIRPYQVSLWLGKVVAWSGTAASAGCGQNERKSQALQVFGSRHVGAHACPICPRVASRSTLNSISATR